MLKYYEGFERLPLGNITGSSGSLPMIATRVTTLARMAKGAAWSHNSMICEA
jgi:hypothetical protein